MSEITEEHSSEPALGTPPRAATALSMAAYATAKIGPALIMFVAIPLWSRMLGPSQYGLYSIVWAASLFSTSIAVGWIRQATLRYAGKAADALEQVRRRPLLISCALSIIPTLVVLSTQFKAAEYTHALLTAISAALFTFVNGVYVIEQTKLQRDELSAKFMIAEVVRLGITLGLSLGVYLATSLSGAWVILFAFVVGTLGGLRAMRRQTQPSDQQAIVSSSVVLRKYWAFGWPMGIWLGISTAFVYVDRFLIRAMVGPIEAGIYASAADVVVRGVTMLSFPLTMISHTRIMRAFNAGDPVRALGINRRYSAYLIILTIATTGVGTIVGRPLLQKLVGVIPENPFVIPLLVAGASIWQLALMTQKSLEMLNRTKLLIVLLTVTTAISVVASIALLPTFGSVVAAAAFCFGGVLYTVATFIAGKVLRRELLRTNTEVGGR